MSTSKITFLAKCRTCGGDYAVSYNKDQGLDVALQCPSHSGPGAYDVMSVKVTPDELKFFSGKGLHLDLVAVPKETSKPQTNKRGKK